MAYEQLARALARRAGLRAFRFFTRRLDPDAPRPALEQLELRMLAEPDVLPLCARPELDLVPDKIRAAYARGDLCAGVFDGQALVGYCWFGFSPVPHLDGVWVDFHAQGVWMYKSLVLPSHRGRRIAPALYRFTDRLCVQRGRSFSISCIETHNRASIAAILRTGYEPAGYAGYLRLASGLVPWSSPRARSLVRFHLPL
jgi:GNAT superfamily N-acetyltransferase